MESVILQYQVVSEQMHWRGKTDKSSFAAIMANTIDDLERFGRKFFPNRKIKWVEG